MNLLYTATTLLEAAATPGEVSPTASLLGMVLPMVLLFGAMYFIMIRPQRKREKQVEEMRSKLEVGDEIVTTGGIIGRVVSIHEDTVVIETGSARSKIRVARWAVQSNNTVSDDVPKA